jgi:hypothetical protein
VCCADGLPFANEGPSYVGDYLLPLDLYGTSPWDRDRDMTLGLTTDRSRTSQSQVIECSGPLAAPGSGGASQCDGNIPAHPWFSLHDTVTVTFDERNFYGWWLSAEADFERGLARACVQRYTDALSTCRSFAEAHVPCATSGTLALSHVPTADDLATLAGRLEATFADGSVIVATF